LKDFSDALKKLPMSPGVYLMKDIQGNVIYVGKAKALKSRVSSYFRTFSAHTPKTQTLVVNIDEFEYILTDTEVEALILEGNLIKQYKPRFNVRLKDDKAYPYIKITHEAFPRVIKVREVKRDKGLYYGPYTSDYDVNQTLDVIKKVFPIRQCHRDLSKKNQRPCLNYHIKQCLGPCKGTVYESDYQKIIQEIVLFLTGKEQELLTQLEAKMMEYAQSMKFERAALIRDQLNSLRHLSVKQKVTSASGIDQDVVGLSREEDKACLMIFFVRNGLLLSRESFMLEDVKNESDSELMHQLLLQFYGGAAFFPKEILLSHAVDDASTFETWLTQLAQKRVYVLTPQKGDKKKLVDMVLTNTREYLDKHFETIVARDRAMHARLVDFAQLLSLNKVPKRIEAYDISNIMGVFSVGSMVVYEQGIKKKSDYRRFKVRTIEGPNDYGSMMEVIYRRFKRAENTEESKGFEKLPDLLLIDGGKGHVKVVRDVLVALGLDSSIPVVGMVKNDRHKTEALFFNGDSIPLDPHSDMFKFVAGVQEEVHRFAISYHRSLRDKAMSQSILDDIPGVGVMTKRKLLTAFQSIDAIRRASVEDLSRIGGVKATLAQTIYEFFNKQSYK
jgi:excinuclease ABC subunit C